MTIWGDHNLLRIERVTGAHPVIDTDHAYIHAGIAFGLSNKMDILSTKVGAIWLAIPAGVYVHFRPTLVSNTGGPVIVSLLEDASLSGSPSVLTPENYNRVGTPPASLVVCKGLADATVVNGAGVKTLSMLVLPGTSVGQALGSASGVQRERVLRPGTNYVVTFTNATSPGATVTVGYDLFWYEEEAA